MALGEPQMGLVLILQFLDLGDLHREHRGRGLTTEHQSWGRVRVEAVCPKAPPLLLAGP